MYCECFALPVLFLDLSNTCMHGLVHCRFIACHTFPDCTCMYVSAISKSGGGQLDLLILDCLYRVSFFSSLCLLCCVFPFLLLIMYLFLDLHIKYETFSLLNRSSLVASDYRIRTDVSEYWEEHVEIGKHHFSKALLLVILYWCVHIVGNLSLRVYCMDEHFSSLGPNINVFHIAQHDLLILHEAYNPQDSANQIQNIDCNR
jgi:hypothetical protein